MLSGGGARAAVVATWAIKTIVGRAAIVRTVVPSTQHIAPNRTKRAGLHPRAYPYTMVLSDGSTVKAWSSSPDTPKVVRMQEDVKNQVPFVLETGNIIDLTGNVAKFERRFNAEPVFKVPDSGSGDATQQAPWESDDDDDDGW
eukprot:m.181273 g.181273  ORF g.181273 m.181273 type:complete len:143 (-) comp15212_c0_seq1:130-558(-)